MDEFLGSAWRAPPQPCCVCPRHWSATAAVCGPTIGSRRRRRETRHRHSQGQLGRARRRPRSRLRPAGRDICAVPSAWKFGRCSAITSQPDWVRCSTRLRPIKPVPPVTKAVLFGMACDLLIKTAIREAYRLKTTGPWHGPLGPASHVFSADPHQCRGSIRPGNHGFSLGLKRCGLPELVAQHDRRPPRQGEVRAGGLVPGRTLVWQLHRPLFRLPVRLVLRLNDDDTGVQIEQQWSVGRLALGC